MMKRARNTSSGFLFDMVRLSIEASAVISHRATTMMLGKTSPREARLMITEKMDALVEAQFVAAAALVAGRQAAMLPSAISVYRRAATKNRKRLFGKK